MKVTTEGSHTVYAHLNVASLLMGISLIIAAVVAFVSIDFVASEIISYVPILLLIIGIAVILFWHSITFTINTNTGKAVFRARGIIRRDKRELAVSDIASVRYESFRSVQRVHTTGASRGRRLGSRTRVSTTESFFIVLGSGEEIKLYSGNARRGVLSTFATSHGLQVAQKVSESLGVPLQNTSQGLLN